MTSTLTGPRIAPKSGVAKQLVVFLHGYGADGKDLIEVGRQWQKLLPDAAFVSPNAPEPCAQSPMGKQWFGLTNRDPDERWIGAQKAAPLLNAFLDEELKAANLPDSALALVGFSQGSMMALHVGPRRAHAPAAILAFSGVLVGPEHLGEAKARSPKGEPPPILLIHGEADETIPVEAMFQSAEDLGGAGIPAQWHLSRGVGHGIDGGGLTHGGMFLAHAFGVKPPTR